MLFDDVINILNKYSNEDNESELGEQDAPSEPSGGSAKGYPTVTKWETGLTRGVANTIDDKVTWSSLYKITRGKANTLL